MQQFEETLKNLMHFNSSSVEQCTEKNYTGNLIAKSLQPHEKERLMPIAVSCSGAPAGPFHGIQLRDPSMESLLAAGKVGSC